VREEESARREVAAEAQEARDISGFLPKAATL
jgi:hypothetical protein